MLGDKDLKRLIALCGRLGSDQDGECAAAARQVSRFLSERSLTWEEVLTPQEQPMMVLSVGVAEKPLVGWRAAARACLQQPRRLRGEREEEFLSDILARSVPTLSERQTAWLEAICQRCGVPRWS